MARGAAPIPFTVIGGFLGAGKTTLLNRLLREAAGTRYAVLVNDFGSLNVDASLVVEHGGDTVALANGCICCSIGDSLIETLLALLARPDRPEHILVEASGVSDPRRIADIAVLDPALAPDLLVINKIDLVNEEALPALDRWLARAAPQAARLPVRDAAVPSALLLGRERACAGRQARSPAGRHDAAATFRSDSWVSERPLDRRRFQAAMADLPAQVLRGKGWLRFADEPELAYVLQRVGRRWQLSKADPGARPPDGCQLTFIGTPGMPPSAVLMDPAVDAPV